MMLGKVLSRKWIATTILVIAAAAVCFRLGVWQMDRLAARQAFNAHMATVRGLAALTLPSHENLVAQEYREVRARGVFDFDHQVAIRNQAHEGQYGYHLLTPLRLESDPETGLDGAQTVLVDRGWIPADGNGRPQDWRKYDAGGAIDVRGIVRLGQSSPAFGGQTQPTLAPTESWAAFWMYVDVAGIQSQLPYGVLPIYIQASQPAGRTEPPIIEIAEMDFSEGPHRGYAAQWFAFSAMLIIGYPFYVNKKEAGQA